MREIIDNLVREDIERACERLSDQAFERLRAEVLECIYKSLNDNVIRDQVYEYFGERAFKRLSVSARNEAVEGVIE